MRPQTHLWYALTRKTALTELLHKKIEIGMPTNLGKLSAHFFPHVFDFFPAWEEKASCLVIYCSLARCSHMNTYFLFFFSLLMTVFPIDKQKINYRQLARINTDSIILSLYLEYPSRQAMREYEQNYVSPFFELHIFIVQLLQKLSKA